MALPSLGLSFTGFPETRRCKEMARGKNIYILKRSDQHLLRMGIKLIILATNKIINMWMKNCICRPFLSDSTLDFTTTIMVSDTAGY